MTRLAKQTRYDSNRKDFSEKLDAGTRGQRGGLFSLPLGLTIGDASTNYQRDRKPAELVGKTKGFSNSRGKSTTAEPFNKLQSNAIGDEYQELFEEHGGEKVSADSFIFCCVFDSTLSLAD